MDDDEPTKIFEKIVHDITSRIKSGELGPGDRLPSEADLMRDYGCSHQPVRNARRHLVEKLRLATSRQGSGWFVRGGPIDPAGPAAFLRHRIAELHNIAPAPARALQTVVDLLTAADEGGRKADPAELLGALAGAFPNAIGFDPDWAA